MNNLIFNTVTNTLKQYFIVWFILSITLMVYKTLLIYGLGIDSSFGQYFLTLYYEPFIAAIVGFTIIINEWVFYSFFTVTTIFFIINRHIAITLNSYLDFAMLKRVGELKDLVGSCIEILDIDYILLTILVFTVSFFVIFILIRKLKHIRRWVFIVITSAFFAYIIFLINLQPVISKTFQKEPFIFLFQSKFNDKLATANSNIDKNIKIFTPFSKYENEIIDEQITVTPPNPKLNVVILLMESFGTVSLGEDLEEEMKTFLALANNGLYFKNFYACVPESIKSIFSLHTGATPFASMKSISYIYPRIDMSTISSFFKSEGYRTALLHGGKFSYCDKLSFLSDRGYDILYDAKNIPNASNYKKIWAGIDDKAIYDYAKEWVSKSSDPFFITFIPICPHHPYEIENSVEYKKKLKPIEMFRNAAKHADTLFGEFVDFLRQINRFNDTLFVLVGDHGEAFGQHKGNKVHVSMIYEENIKVPLLISNTQIFNKPLISYKIGQIQDVFPTILDIMSQKINTQGEGVSLLSDIDKRMVFFYTDCGSEKVGLRDGQFKYIYDIDSKYDELYNLQNDTCEKINLSNIQEDRTNYYRKKAISWLHYNVSRIQQFGKKKNRIIKLTELPVLFCSQDWGSISYNRSIQGNVLCVNNKKFNEGIGTHANSIIIFDVSNYHDYIFYTKFGRDFEAEIKEQRVTCEIWLDGKVVFQSKPLSSYDDCIEIIVPISSGNHLSLVVTQSNDAGHSDHADWINPMMIYGVKK